MNFRYLNIKQAIIYTTLSQYRRWFTICRQRKKSGKKFYMDSLIDLFYQIVKKAEIENIYDMKILPKKHVRHIQKKNMKTKIHNILFDEVSKSNYKKVTDLILNGSDLQSLGVFGQRNAREMRCAHRACMNGDIKMCSMLHSFGVNWQSEDSQKMTPLFYAIQSQNLSLVKYLIQNIKVNLQKVQIQSRTPFYWACTEGNMNIITYLYEIGASINKKSSLGRSALSKSCYLGRVDITRFLISCPEIDLYSQDKKGRTALHNAVFGPKGGRQGHKFGTNTKDSPQCAQILLQNNFKVDFVDYENNTSLHIAMSSQAIDSIRLLLAYNASLTVLNKYNETPIMTGSKFGHLQAVKLLYEEYGSSIQHRDAFNKNIIQLTAKFRQHDENQKDAINSVYLYIVDKFIKQLQVSKNYKQLYDTFYVLLQNKVGQELIYFIKKCQIYQIKVPILSLIHIKQLLSLHLILEKSHQQEHLDLYLLESLNLTNDHIDEFVTWIYAENNIKILEFVRKHQFILFKQYYEIFKSKQINQQLPLQPLIQLMGSLKQKVISYCLLNLPLNWLTYLEQQTSNNIIHCLIRCKKVGTLIQIMKVLSGKQMKFTTNIHIKKQTLLKNSNKNLQDIWICQQQKLLQHHNQDGFQPYSYAKLLKKYEIVKILEQTVKCYSFQIKHNWDIKDYKVIQQNNQDQLMIFNMGFQKQLQLQQLIISINNVQDIEQLIIMEPILKYKFQLAQAIKLWSEIQHRQLFIINSIQQLHHLQAMLSATAVGIDIQYSNQQGIIIISLLQISTFTTDYIIDMLTAANNNLYLEFKQILKQKYIQPLLYNTKILKIMHGADHDLYLLKSIFNVSILSFIDTARIDLELKHKNQIRGLSVLCKEYMQIILLKDYQVSEWRIRPIPKAMLSYARKDSYAVLLLANHMLNNISLEQYKTLFINGCKQARKNKKILQCLIKNIII